MLNTNPQVKLHGLARFAQPWWARLHGKASRVRIETEPLLPPA
jgi:hypothetical protein